MKLHTYTPGTAELELVLLSAEAESISDTDFYARLCESGLSGEAAIRLKSLVDLTVVSDRMLDPAAAQFKEVTYIESDLQNGDEPTRHVVCGMVNGKNSYGGYVGFTTFWVDAGTSGSPIVNVCGSDSPAKEACLMGAEIYCTKAVRKSIPEERM